jgi:hypothetical protein
VTTASAPAETSASSSGGKRWERDGLVVSTTLVVVGLALVA